MSSDKQNEDIELKEETIEEKASRIDVLKKRKEDINKQILEELKKARQKEQRAFLDIVRRSVEANKVQDLKDKNNVVMVYGLFELFSKMTDDDKKNLKKRSMEIEKVFLAERKARNKKKEDENLEAKEGHGE